jgi:hypothetical protein
MQKEAETTTGDAKEAIKNVNFYSNEVAYASLDTVNKLAKAFETEINKLIVPNSYNEALGGYRINLSEIALNGIDQINTLIAESLESIFESVIKNIKSAIGGNLSIADKTNLIAQLG